MPSLPNTRTFMSKGNFVCAVVKCPTHWCGYVMMSTELFNALQDHFINLEFDDTITYEGESIFGAVYGKAIGFDTNHSWQAKANLNTETYALKATKDLAAAVEKLCAAVL